MAVSASRTMEVHKRNYHNLEGDVCMIIKFEARMRSKDLELIAIGIFMAQALKAHQRKSRVSTS